MNTAEFDELAGRIEGIGRALLVLAAMMEKETCMDGLTLSNQWRRSVAAEPSKPQLQATHRTLHELAQALDEARSQYQQQVADFRARNHQ